MTTHPLRVALYGSWSAHQRQAWWDALTTAAPDCVWVASPQPQQALDAVVVGSLPPGALRDVRGVRLIQSLWAGVDRLLGDPELPGGAAIARMVDPFMTQAMTQTALWAVLGVHRRFFDYALQQRQGVWATLPQRRAQDCRILILGLGTLGREVASALSAAGYAVSGWRQAAPDSAQASGPVPVLHGMPALMSALSQTHIVINLLPLTPRTRGILSRELFEALPRGCALINLARGAHLVEQDLLDAMQSGHIAHAVLDVFSTEPLPASHAFWSHPHITVLPHIAALTDIGSAAQVVAANLRRLHSGQALMHLVDRQRGY